MTYITPDSAQLVQAPEEIRDLVFKQRALITHAKTGRQVVIGLLFSCLLVFISQSIVYGEYVAVGVGLVTFIASVILFFVEKELVKTQKKIRELMQRPEEV